MLQISKSKGAAEQVAVPAEFLSLAELYAATTAFVHRQYSTILYVSLFVLGLGVIYLLTTPAQYTGNAVLVIDTHKNQVFQATSPLGDLPIDSGTVDTQIEILTSENIALAVIKEMHLSDEPEFTSPSDGLFGAVVGTAIGLVVNTFDLLTAGDSGGAATSAEQRRTQRALETFKKKLKVKRVALTYAIEIDFKSKSAERAAKIANAVADAYVVDALDAKYQTTRRAAVWLQDRLKELREESSKAERAVIDYKAKNNIVDTGGRLINEQQLAEINSALVQARAQNAEAKARFDRVQQIMAAGDVDPSAAATATVTDTLKNDVITKLRQQYLDYEARAANWAGKYGESHLAVINLRNQMREFRRAIFNELQRIAETYRSDYEIAKTREESLQKSLDKIVSESQSTNEAQVTLHNLESNSQTYRALYDNFLQRYMESVQQQSFPVSESRLITSARRPQRKSSPKPLLILPLAIVGGLILGVGVGALRDISDRVFRTTSQVEEHLQADCLSVIPLLREQHRLLPRISGRPKEPPGAQLIARDQSIAWTATDAPLSRFAESIRAIKVAADVGVIKGNKVIGITSALPNEGKSMVAMSLAQIIAQGGGRVLLVDCDLRNPSLTRMLASKAKRGLLEAISGQSLADLLWIERTTELALLPAVLPTRLPHSSQILASPAMKLVFDRLREAFDYIIVDLSPLAPIVDVRAMAHLVDSFVFVVEWGRTKIDVAEHALANAHSVYENLLGVVLNKADMDTFGRYESNRGSYYYNRYYARYGYTD